MNKVLILGSHGMGDSIQSLQCAHFVSNQTGKENVDVISCTRDEVFHPLNHLFGDLFELFQHPKKETWGHDNYILNNQSELESLSYYNEIYYSIPDLLYHHPLAFDYQKYNTNPQLIKQTRLLAHKYKPTKRVYLGLCSSTDGYLYNNISQLIRRLGQELPDFEFYFPNVKVWADKMMDYDDLSNMPSNVTIHENPNFCESLEIMKTCCYGVYTCNGPSHSAFQLGQPRLLLDPQYNKVLWCARWREDMSECVDINTSVTDVVNIVKSNLLVPSTTLIPRQKVLDILIKNDYQVDWRKELLWKY